MGYILKPALRDVLLTIANQFYKSLEVDMPLEDVLLIGSSANFNWTKYSDIDLHLLLDFQSKVNGDLFKKYFDSKKVEFNNKFDLTYKGHKIEVYIQDVDEANASEGVYSILNDEWIKMPTYRAVEIDDEIINKKALFLMSEIDNLIDNGGSLEALSKLKEKIRNFRKAGLEEGGEYSPENLAFKALRNNGYLEKLNAYQKNKQVEDFGLDNIQEAKQRGTLYHYTSAKSFLNILKQDFLQANPMDWGEKNKIVLKPYKDYNYISLTRDKNFNINEGSVVSVRMVLDGDKLSERYKILPYSYWTSSDDPSIMKGIKLSTSKITDRYQNESEERLLTKSSGVVDLNAYVLKYEVLVDSKLISMGSGYDSPLDLLKEILKKETGYRRNKIVYYLDGKIIDNGALVDMVFEEPKQQVAEAKQVGNIYHFTTVSSIPNIIKTNSLITRKFDSSLDYELTKKVLQPYKDYHQLSLTRDKNFHKIPRVIGGTTARIVLDGNKLSEKYKIIPFYYWDKSKQNIKYNESEERLVLKGGDLKNLDKYVLSYDIFIEPKFPPISLKPILALKHPKIRFVVNDKYMSEEELRNILWPSDEKQQVAESKIIKYDSWVVPDLETLKREYHVEHELKGNDYFSSLEEFLKAIKNAKVETIKGGDIDHTTRTSSYEDLLSLIKQYKSYPQWRNEKTLKALYDKFEANEPLDYPIVLEFPNGSRRIFSGNTRLNVAEQLNIPVEVLIIKAKSSLNEEIEKDDLKVVAKYADNYLDPKDIEFSNHFLDRVNDPRNKKDIGFEELVGFFKRLSKQKDKFLDLLKKYREIVATDDKTAINIPFVNQANKAIAKTVMRKPNFYTPDPQLVFENTINTADSIIAKSEEIAKQNRYLNCDAFCSALVNGANFKSEFKKLPPNTQLRAGDIIAFGDPSNVRHYAVYTKDGKTVEVEQWGAAPRESTVADAKREYEEIAYIFRNPSNKLNEAKQVGTVYHFTSISSALQIIADNKLGKNDTTISTTRDKNFVVSGPRAVSGNEISFILDGDKLSERYKTTPYDYNNDNPGEEVGDEQEETIWGKRLEKQGGIKDIKSYIKGIILTKHFFHKIHKLGLDFIIPEQYKSYLTSYNMAPPDEDKWNDEEEYEIVNLRDGDFRTTHYLNNDDKINLIKNIIKGEIPNVKLIEK